MMHAYMLVVDASFSRPYDLHQFVTTHSGTLNWWHYLTSCYVIVSKINLHAMQDELHKKFPSDKFLLIDINPHHKNGWLPQEAWDWFNQFRTWSLTFTHDA